MPNDTGEYTITVEYNDSESGDVTYDSNTYYLDNSVTTVTKGLNVYSQNTEQEELVLQEDTESGEKYYEDEFETEPFIKINILIGEDAESGLKATSYLIENVSDNGDLTKKFEGTINESAEVTINEYGKYKLKITSTDNMGNEESEEYYIYLKEIKKVEDTKYIIEYYYQKDDGTYSDTADDMQQRTAKIGETVNVTEEDKVPELENENKYAFDESNINNKLSGELNQGDELTLKVYFKQQYTVAYKPGTKGTFSIQTTENLDYNSNTPEFVGEITGADGYKFDGWSPEVEEKVTGDIEYVAKWITTRKYRYK